MGRIKQEKVGVWYLLLPIDSSLRHNNFDLHSRSLLMLGPLLSTAVVDASVAIDDELLAVSLRRLPSTTASDRSGRLSPAVVFQQLIRDCSNVLRKVQEPLLGKRRREQLRHVDSDGQDPGTGHRPRPLQAIHCRLQPPTQASTRSTPAAAIHRLPQKSSHQPRQPSAADERTQCLQKHPAR